MGVGVILDLVEQTKDELNNLMDEIWCIKNTSWSAKTVIWSLPGDKLSTPGFLLKSTGSVVGTSAELEKPLILLKRIKINRPLKRPVFLNHPCLLN